MFTRTALALGAVGLGCAVKSFTSDKRADGVCAKYFIPSGYRTIREIVSLSHDTKIFRINFPKSSSEQYMRPGSTLELKVFDGNTFFSRFFTPVTPNGSVGYCDLVIKLMPEGRVTSSLWKMRAGDKLWVSPWDPSRERYRPNKYKQIGMLAGGVGITPMLQLVREVVTNPYDTTKITLLYVNKTPQDIVLKEELDRLAEEYPDKFSVTHCITRPTRTDGWKGPIGHVSAGMLQQLMPPPGRDTAIYVSGPDGFVNSLTGLDTGLMAAWSQPGAAKRQPQSFDILPRDRCYGLLGGLGYSKEVIVF
eukprot:TRINITY_DN54963_c0_g1_i1.p1 TRINITY_DN54963_c0_g1~~TRINITY_DN54963_c0_g1_i1.p1  ORF type:complete len:306 (+),score=41.57 TRINITY_DN54963_c0_g1_i1:25-942(+)